jgi:multidrug efflux pump subunit AcrB
VLLKMLPFDNKSEFQVIVDMPAGTPVEQTAAVLHELGAHLATVPEVTDYQAYAGTAAPINFNGLVRQYYLRSRRRGGRHAGQPGGQAPPQRPKPRHRHAGAPALQEIGKRMAPT